MIIYHIHSTDAQLTVLLCCGLLTHIQHAISQGAVAVARPEDKMWGQKVCYVRDLNGNVVRMGSVVGDGK